MSWPRIRKHAEVLERIGMSIQKTPQPRISRGINQAENADSPFVIRFSPSLHAAWRVLRKWKGDERGGLLCMSI